MLDQNNPPEAREVAEDVSDDLLREALHAIDDFLHGYCKEKSEYFKERMSDLAYNFRIVSNRIRSSYKLKPEPTPTVCQHEWSTTEYPEWPVCVKCRECREIAAEPTPVRTAPEDACPHCYRYELCGHDPGCPANPPVAPVRALDEFLSVCEGECEHPYCWSQNPPVAPVRVAESVYEATDGHCERDGLIDIEQEVDGRWIAEVPSIPGAMAYGSTPREAAEKAYSIAYPKPTMEPQELPLKFWNSTCDTTLSGHMVIAREGQAPYAYTCAGVEQEICDAVNGYQAALARAEKAEALNAELKGNNQDPRVCGVCKKPHLLWYPCDMDETLAKLQDFTFSNLSGSTTTIDIETAQRNYGRHLKQTEDLRALLASAEGTGLHQAERIKEVEGQIRVRMRALENMHHDAKQQGAEMDSLQNYIEVAYQELLK